MKLFLPNASSALTTTILTATLTLTNVTTKAAESSYEYNPAAELTTKFSKGRNIGELNYMQPFLANNNHLPILDGDKALELAKKIVIRIIKDNIPNIGNNVDNIHLVIKTLLQLTPINRLQKNILIA